MILLVEDDEKQQKITRLMLKKAGYPCKVVADGTSALELLKVEEFDLILLDINLLDMNGLELLEIIKEKLKIDSEVIILTGYASIENAVKAIKIGAFDFLEKPLQFDTLNIVLEKVYEKINLKHENIRLRQELKKRYKLKNIVANSGIMQEIIRQTEMLANKSTTILIMGESGTGKELIARALHYNSFRAEKPFVKVDCASLTPELLQSELFGHVKGAFTGAYTDKIGKFEYANGGTVFLDEIGEIPESIQVQLLRFLQEKKFEKVGDLRTISTNVRVVAATNRNLEEELKKGKFRQDLYYRINVVTIKVPPLRERKEDIPYLAQHFIEKYCMENNLELKKLTPQVLRVLMNYSWPGNVRELENCIEYCVVMGKSDVIYPSDLPKAITSGTITIPQNTKMDDNVFSIPLDCSLTEVERFYIKKVLELYNFNQNKAAVHLGIHRNTLARKIKEYGIEP